MRIRTIKPEFFLHEKLYDLEKESKLPIRLSFAGLWCAADRAGRFKWEPRKLKAQILPYDDIDFSRVLDALTTRAFLVRYASGTGEFGCIPSFPRHQVINNRERDSELPAPPQDALQQALDACPTRAPRVEDACPTVLNLDQVEGKGTRKGMEGNIPPNPQRGNNALLIYAAYPLKVGKPAALRSIAKALTDVPFEQLLAKTQAFAAARNGDTAFCPHPATWFNQQRYNDDPATWAPKVATNGNSFTPQPPKSILQKNLEEMARSAERAFGPNRATP